MNRRCRTCTRIMDISYFEKSEKSKDGITISCVKCIASKKNRKRKESFCIKDEYSNEMTLADTKRYLNTCQNNLPCKSVVCMYTGETFMLPDFGLPIFKNEFSEDRVNKWIIKYKRKENVRLPKEKKKISPKL